MADITTIRSIVAIQLFFGVAITIFAYILAPYTGTVAYADILELDNLSSVNGSISNLENSLNSQTNLPLTDIGSLTFYSSNIIIDLFLNVFTAIPQMVTLAFDLIFRLLTIDSFLQLQIKIVVLGLVTATYYIGIIGSIMNMRSGRGLI